MIQYMYVRVQYRLCEEISIGEVEFPSSHRGNNWMRLRIFLSICVQRLLQNLSKQIEMFF